MAATANRRDGDSSICRAVALERGLGKFFAVFAARHGHELPGCRRGNFRRRFSRESRGSPGVRRIRTCGSASRLPVALHQAVRVGHARACFHRGRRVARFWRRRVQQMRRLIVRHRVRQRAMHAIDNDQHFLQSVPQSLRIDLNILASSALPHHGRRATGRPLGKMRSSPEV